MTAQRRTAVTQARDAWVSRLIDLSRRNKLLYYRELKAGALELTDHDPAVMRSLLEGDSVTLAQLLPRADEVPTSSRAQEIRRSALANREEKGLETLAIAFGFATWPSADGGRAPVCAVALAPVALEKRGREGRTLALKIIGEFTVNPVLTFALETGHGRQIDPDSLLQLSGDPDQEGTIDPERIYAHLENAAAGIKDFQVARRQVLGNFAFHKMAMVKDLNDNLDALAAHDLIAAIAGDSAAREAIGSAGTQADPTQLDQVAPDNEFLVLDADSSQQVAVSSVLAGRSGVIIGPPGTGKSQTIANLIAELAARGRRVLFVAEKRAALDVVLHRLENRGLRHLALDLHGAGITRRAVMTQFSESLDLVRNSQPVDCEELHRIFIDRRKRLVQHAEALHRPRPPCGLSAYELQGRLLHFSPDERSSVRWRGADLDRLPPAAKDEGRDLIAELEGFAGLLMRTDSSPWATAQFTDGESVQLAIDSLSRLLNEFWPRLQALLAAVLDETKATPPARLDELQGLLGLLNGTNLTLERFDAAIFRQDLDALKSALAPAAGRLSAALAWCFNGNYRRARKMVQGLRKDGETSARKLLEQLIMADAQLRQWSAMTAGRAPIASASVGECRHYLDATLAELKQLIPTLGRGDLTRYSFGDLGALINDLTSDQNTPYRLPRLYFLQRRLAELGLGAIVDEIRKRRPQPPAWPRLLEHAWLSSCLGRARAEDSSFAGFDGRVLDRFRQEFCRQDEERVQIAALRVRRAHAERALQAMNSFPDQDALVRREAAKKARHLPLRSLVTQAPDVLTALRPCWLASPLSVSELIPARHCFDVVLFDEASQVLPEDAVPALLRAGQAVVAGDPNQLPPTTFFEIGGDEDEEAQSESEAEGFESLLDQMIPVIARPWSLDWHYRSLDEALIAFSNRHIYADRLITFPGPGGPPSMSHVAVPWAAGRDGQEESSAPEVRKVVELILRHAVERPGETLGVIAMGIKHSQQLQAALDQALASRPEVSAFFAEDRKERFFVKNLERVQGDERDAIILTIGYGKDRTGRLLYRFGPLLVKGGERRLNVAITRARRRMTVVSSFDHRDMDPDRSKARGVELLRLYLEYAASRGKLIGDAGETPFAPDSFEADVQAALQAKGIDLIPQYGVSRYRIDLVAKHPQRPGRLVLAIECDGASYHSAYTARDRDRLRQQHLEALGWRFHRIWSTDWFMRRAQEIERAVAAYHAAVADCDAAELAHPAPAPQTDEIKPGVAAGEEQIIRTASNVNFGPPRPHIPKRQSIDEYALAELVAAVEWIESDGKLRTDEEVVEEAIRMLGFSRKGNRIEAALRNAIAYSRQHPPAGHNGKPQPPG
ncbi:MAG TPA: AAA domain-containing protein [Candidatus Binataceae bacterium]|nr:AAA domain-containing protein [Candidatus Binataceae bacterium]